MSEQPEEQVSITLDSFKEAEKLRESEPVADKISYEYVQASSRIATVLEEMYTTIHGSLLVKTDNPHELTLQLLQAGYNTAMASINIKANYSKVMTRKIGFNNN